MLVHVADRCADLDDENSAEKTQEDKTITRRGAGDCKKNGGMRQNVSSAKKERVLDAVNRSAYARLTLVSSTSSRQSTTGRGRDEPVHRYCRSLCGSSRPTGVRQFSA